VFPLFSPTPVPWDYIETNNSHDLVTFTPEKIPPFLWTYSAAARKWNVYKKKRLIAKHQGKFNKLGLEAGKNGFFFNLVQHPDQSYDPLRLLHDAYRGRNGRSLKKTTSCGSALVWSYTPLGVSPCTQFSCCIHIALLTFPNVCSFYMKDFSRYVLKWLYINHTKEQSKDIIQNDELQELKRKAQK
jgi:hypothetical protein